MKYLCTLFFLLLYSFMLANVCIASQLPLSSVDPNDIEGDAFIDPYDVNNNRKTPNFIDPYDQPQVIEEPVKKRSVFPVFTQALLTDSKESWQDWKKRHITSPKPPLNWSQVGTEIGAGYLGAFGGSMLGLFSGFMIGTLYDAVSPCERCWVDVAINMTTIGAGLGATAGVYMFGSDNQQQGSISVTYMSTIIPVLIGTVAYRDSRQINKSGFYLMTMPLFAAVGFNWTRHYRGAKDKPLFENLFIDDMWLSQASPEALEFNIRFKF